MGIIWGYLCWRWVFTGPRWKVISGNGDCGGGLGGVLWALLNLRSWAFLDRPETFTLQSQSQEEKEVEVGVGVDCGADGRVRHITWSLMLMYAQWAQNQ